MNKLSLSELKSVYREKGIKNYSKLNKSELVKYIKKNMMDCNPIKLTRITLLELLYFKEENLLLRISISLIRRYRNRFKYI